MKVLRIHKSTCEVINLLPRGVYSEMKTMQGLIGGYMEAVRIADDAVMLVDVDGIAKLLRRNPAASEIAERSIFGKALIVGVDDEKFCDFPERYLQEVQNIQKRA